MKIALQKTGHNRLLRVGLIFGGILFNVVMSFFSHKYGLPIYLDTIGTMLVALVGGLFPAIVTAVLSNVFGTLFSSEVIYFGFENLRIIDKLLDIELFFELLKTLSVVLVFQFPDFFNI